MRILVIGNLWPSVRSPESGSFVRDQVAELERASVVVDVAAVATDSASVWRRYLLLTYRVLRRCWRGDFDLIACHIAFPTGLVGLLARRMTGARLVLHAHGSDVMAVAERTRVHRALARYTFSTADHVVANSEFMREQILRRFEISRRQIDVVSPGLAHDFYQPSNGPRAGVLYAGRLTPGKGVDLLMRALARLPSHLTPGLSVIGQGPSEDELKALAEELGLSVTWWGAQSRSFVAEAMRSAAVLAVPSTLPEGLGLTAIEGLASGAIVVASRGGALADTITEGVTGYAADVGDIDALSSALQRALELYSAPVDHGRVVTQGRLVAHTHSPTQAADRLKVVYQSVVERPRDTKPRGRFASLIFRDRGSS